MGKTKESPGWMFGGGIAWRLERGRLAGAKAGGPGVLKVRVSTLRPGSARAGWFWQECWEQGLTRVTGLGKAVPGGEHLQVSARGHC